MKVPVYLEATLELLGVVHISSDQLDRLKEQGYYRAAIYPDLPARVGTYDAFSAETINVAVFRYFPLKNARGASSICLTVTDRKDLRAWPTQLWPRRRKDRARGRLLKSTTRFMASGLAGHRVSAVFRDDLTS